MSETSSASDTGRFHVPDIASVHHRRPAVAPLVRDTYALVLAGGRGTRLHELTAWRAKPAVPFGGKHRIIDFALWSCINSGVRRIGVATQYKAHTLIQHLQRGWNFLDSHLHEFLESCPPSSATVTRGTTARRTRSTRTSTCCGWRSRASCWCWRATTSTRWTTA